MSAKTIGVLALQGGYAAHERMLQSLGHATVQVRGQRQLDQIEGLVLPGGESSTQVKLMDELGLTVALSRFFRRGFPVLATCAGLIVAARRVTGPRQPSLGWIDVDVVRNGYGRQLDSFASRSDDGELPLVFIRAPRIRRVGHAVEVLASHEGEPVLVRQGVVTAATFHPELTNDSSVHAQIFGDRVAGDVLPTLSSKPAAQPRVLSVRR